MNKNRIERRESSSAKTFWIFKTACFNRSHIPPRETSGYFWLLYPSRSRERSVVAPFAGCHFCLCLLQRLLRIAAGDLVIPGGMMRPRPSFAHRSPGHRLSRAGLAEGTEIDVEENPKQHDERRHIVDHIRDRDQQAPKNLRKPHDDARNDVSDAAANNLPELHLLPGVKEAGLRGFYGVAAGDVLFNVLHPARIGRSPAHHAQPVQRLQSEEDHKAQAEPGMQEACRRASAEKWSEEAEDPRQIDPEPRQQREEEKDPDHPVEKAGVDGMAQQFAGIDDGSTATINHVGAMYEAIGRSRHLVLLSRGRRWRVNSHYRRGGLFAPWTLENIMHDHTHEAQHCAEQSNRFEDVLPDGEAQRNARFRGQVAVALGLGCIVQHVDHMRAADGVGVVNPSVLKSRDLAQLRSAIFGHELHVLFGSEVQTPSGTRLDARRLQPCSHSVRTQCALVYLFCITRQKKSW